MQIKHDIQKGRVILLPLILALTLCLSSCGQVWGWLWSRNLEAPVDSADLIMGGQPADEDWIFEGAVSFTGEAHSGTDIYYVGDRESPNCTRVIVIDAGHQLKGSSAKEPVGPGSTDMKDEVTQGATGDYTGQKEYELNLEVALLLRNELIRRGYSVVMIRETNNVSISNMERAEIANKYNAAAFIRIHANSWMDQRNGAMTICQTAQNPYPDCARHYERSRLLSALVLNEFCAQTEMEKATNPLLESDAYTGTNWSRVPTTIIEMGFLSNEADDTFMESPHFRQAAAKGIANGLDAYFKALDSMETEGDEPAEAGTDTTRASTAQPTDGTPQVNSGEDPDETPEGTAAEVESAAAGAPSDETAQNTRSDGEVETDPADSPPSPDTGGAPLP